LRGCTIYHEPIAISIGRRFTVARRSWFSPSVFTVAVTEVCYALIKMAFTLMQKSSFAGTSLATKQAQQTCSAKVSTHLSTSRSVLFIELHLAASMFTMLQQKLLACFACKVSVIERCSTCDGTVGCASHRQARWHASQEGPEDCKEGS